MCRASTALGNASNFGLLNKTLSEEKTTDTILHICPSYGQNGTELLNLVVAGLDYIDSKWLIALNVFEWLLLVRVTNVIINLDGHKHVRADYGLGLRVTVCESKSDIVRDRVVGLDRTPAKPTEFSDMDETYRYACRTACWLSEWNVNTSSTPTRLNWNIFIVPWHCFWFSFNVRMVHGHPGGCNELGECLPASLIT